AVVIGLKGYSVVNSELREETGEIILKKYFNIGIGVDTKDGLIVPVIRDADNKSILRLAEIISDMAEKGRSRSLDIKELKGGTFSITNIGSLGGTYSTPVIFYPQAAILATGKVQEKPVVIDGKIVIRKIMPVSLTFDHRIMDGGVAARFVNVLKTHLEDPGLLLLELR
ncbi:MAG: 2-oxo acid dehydrogenase subunit E2, partial [Nitrospinota bacterium]